MALVAAYAIALQALFAGLSLGVRAGEAALFAAAPLCLTDPSHPDHAPLERMPCCFGAACCQVGGEPAALPELAAFPARALVGRTPYIAPIDAAGAVASRSPQQPRAPPVA